MLNKVLEKVRALRLASSFDSAQNYEQERLVTVLLSFNTELDINIKRPFVCIGAGMFILMLVKGKTRTERWI